MNNIGSFSNYLSEYQDFARDALYESSVRIEFLQSSGHFYGNSSTYGVVDVVLKISNLCGRLILSLPLYLANGAISLVGRIKNLIALNPQEISKIHRPSFPYSTIGEEALNFARQQIAKHPQDLSVITSYDGSGLWYKSEYHVQPANQEIILLTALYDNIFKPALLNHLKQNPEDPWSQKTVIEAADACMKIGYAISALSLDDLSPFNEKVISSGFFARAKVPTNLQKLSMPLFYQSHTFYTCTKAYHLIRGGLYYKEQEESYYFPERQTPPFTGIHSDRGMGEKPSEDNAIFYKEQTVQNSWNILYNDYCDRVELYLPDRDPMDHDEKYLKWTQKDTEPAAFFHTPTSY